MRHVVAAAFVLSATVVAQQPPPDPRSGQTPTFQSGVTYVEVAATVLGKDGRTIDDLRKEEFALLEGGKPQAIATFTRIDIPLETEAPAAPSPPSKAPVFADSISNTAVSGRVFALVLDEQQTQFRDSHRVMDAATRFVEQFAGAGDLIAVVSTGGVAAQSFTTEKAFALRAIDRFRGIRGASAAEAGGGDMTLNLDATEPWMKALASSPNAVLKKKDDCMALLRTAGTLSALGRYMARIPQRRRSIVLFGAAIRAFGACDDQDDRIVQNAIDDLNRNGVTVYGVDERGLPEAGTPLGIPDYGADPNRPGWASVQHDEVKGEQDTLHEVSNLTGGFATVNFNDLRPTFTRIMRENSSYYLLGFVPADDHRDGKFHAIDVKVSRPEVVVAARKGYIAVKDKAGVEAAGARTSPALGEALASPVAVTDIPMRASVAVFRGNKKLTALSLTVELDASKFAFREVGGTHTDALEVALYSARRGKATLDTHEMVQLSLGDNYAAVRERGLRVGQRVEMPPGHHRLLIGLRETNGGLIGTLPFELDVPDFSKSTPAISSIVVASAEAARIQTTHADLTLKGVLPAPPTALRTFARGDSLGVFAEVYGTPSQLAGVAVSATVDREDGTYAADVEATAHERRGDATVPYTGRVDLGTLAPGRYAVTVTATRPGGKPVGRSTPIEIR